MGFEARTASTRGHLRRGLALSLAQTEQGIHLIVECLHGGGRCISGPCPVQQVLQLVKLLSEVDRCLLDQHNTHRVISDRFFVLYPLAHHIGAIIDLILLRLAALKFLIGDQGQRIQAQLKHLSSRVNAAQVSLQSELFLRVPAIRHWNFVVVEHTYRGALLLYQVSAGLLARLRAIELDFIRERLNAILAIASIIWGAYQVT